MNLKNKIAFTVALFFTIIFAIAATVIYVLFSNFRKEEFESRLKNKAITSIKLLIEVEEVDNQLLKIIDKNSITKLYNEKTLIFDKDYHLIYSSLDDTKINWSINDLQYLKENKTFFKKDDTQEVYGVLYKTNNQDYYALISASDNYGKRKLEYLLYLLIGTYITLTIICWISIFFIVKKSLFPLYGFYEKIKGINENNLDTRIGVKKQEDEIDLLANEFNQMLSRIDDAYNKQKEFTANASHELRTPIARIVARIENKILAPQTDADTKIFLKNILVDTNQIADLTTSLLLLSKVNNQVQQALEVCRIDELIFDTAEKLDSFYPDFKLSLNIQDNDEMDGLLDVKGNKGLLEIAFLNLLKNAYLYASDKIANVTILVKNGTLVIQFYNNGETLDIDEQSKMFEPFVRGKNSKDKQGLGLGLRIVQRILLQYNASIGYSISQNNYNVFTVVFNK